jgi:hypothetical protein
MPEVCEQASHTAALGIQRGKIRERIRFFRLDIRLRRLQLYAAFVWLPLASILSIARICKRFDAGWQDRLLW